MPLFVQVMSRVEVDRQELVVHEPGPRVVPARGARGCPDLEALLFLPRARTALRKRELLCGSARGRRRPPPPGRWRMLCWPGAAPTRSVSTNVLPRAVPHRDPVSTNYRSRSLVEFAMRTALSLFWACCFLQCVTAASAARRAVSRASPDLRQRGVATSRAAALWLPTADRASMCRNASLRLTKMSATT